VLNATIDNVPSFKNSVPCFQQTKWYGIFKGGYLFFAKIFQTKHEFRRVLLGSSLLLSLRLLFLSAG